MTQIARLMAMVGLGLFCCGQPLIGGQLARLQKNKISKHARRYGA